MSEEPPVPRPKTADGFLVKKPSAVARAAERQSNLRRSDAPDSKSAAASSSQRKRARTSDIVVQERPAKRGRTEGEAVAALKNPNAPNTSKVAAAQAPTNMDQVSATVEDAGELEDPNDIEVVQDDANVDEVDGTDDEDNEDDEPVGPPGSDDYHGEIFSSPAEAVEDVEGDVLDNVSVADEGAVDEEEELDQLLGDEGEEYEGELGGSRYAGQTNMSALQS